MVAKLFQMNVPEDDPPSTNRNSPNTRLIDNVNQIRSGNRRLPTPEKAAILELSDSFERRRLGKHQQMLHDISQRCREQEVADLSMKLTKKCNRMQQRAVAKNEMAFYNTASMTPRTGKTNRLDKTLANSNAIDAHLSTRPTYEKNNTHFPARKVMRTQKKSELINLNPMGTLTSVKTKSDCSLSAFFKVQKENFESPRRVNNYTIKAEYATKRNDSQYNPPRYFENFREMENYFFPKKRQTSFLPRIPVEQSLSHDKVKAYLESLRHQKERALSAKSGNSNIKIKSDSGIYMMNHHQERGFSPMDPISTKIGSSTLVTNRDKYTYTQTSITSFL